MQLRKLPEWVAARRRNAAILRDAFGALPALRVPAPPQEVFHAYYRLYAFVQPQALRPTWTRDRILQEIAALGVPISTGSCAEIYLEKAFTPEMRPHQRLPVARELGETSLAFVVHPTLTAADMHDMARIVEHVLAQATV